MGSVAAAALGTLPYVTEEGGAAEQPGTDIVFQRHISVRHEVDVFVAGGGPSGVAAAVAASRQVARVFPASYFWQSETTAWVAWVTPACCLCSCLSQMGSATWRVASEKRSRAA